MWYCHSYYMKLYYATYRYLGVDECAVASNPCQHQCINRPHTYECICHTGYKLKDDKLTCEGKEGNVIT